MKINCPHCSQHIEVPNEMLGQVAGCPTCEGSIQLPTPEPRNSVSPPPLPDAHAPSAIDYVTAVRGPMSRYEIIDGIYLAPDIPPEKEGNARASCAVPSQEPILALIDSTKFSGSAEKCILFTPIAIHCCHGLASNRVRIDYPELPYQN